MLTYNCGITTFGDNPTVIKFRTDPDDITKRCAITMIDDSRMSEPSMIVSTDFNDRTSTFIHLPGDVRAQYSVDGVESAIDVYLAITYAARLETRLTDMANVVLDHALKENIEKFMKLVSNCYELLTSKPFIHNESSIWTVVQAIHDLQSRIPNTKELARRIRSVSGLVLTLNKLDASVDANKEAIDALRAAIRTVSKVC